MDWIFPEGERGWAGVDEINMGAAARDRDVPRDGSGEAMEALWDRCRWRQRD